MIEWQWSRFEDLSLAELYEVMAVRQAVFVVEQRCAYQDADGLDRAARHLLGWRTSGGRRSLVAYLRVIAPGMKFAEPSIGRVLTAPAARGQGLGKAAMAEAIRRIGMEYPRAAIRVSAQRYLEDFYRAFGFATVGEPYDEDGIPHVQMLRERSD